MRPHVSALTFILSSLSLAQAAVYDRHHAKLVGRQNAIETSRQNLAEGFMSMFGRVAGGAGQTVTETIRQTITVGAAGAEGVGANATAVTVTVTAAASTVTVCPGQAVGAVDGNQTGDLASVSPSGVATSALAPPPAVGEVVASGGIGVTVIPVPADAVRTSAVQNTQVTSPSTDTSAIVDATSTDTAANADATSTETSANAEATPTETPANTEASTLAPLPTDTTAIVQPPGLSSTTSGASLSPLPSLSSLPGLADPASSTTSLSPLPTLQTPPGLADPTSPPVAGAPASESSSETTLASTATSTLAPLPGIASSLDSTLSLGSTGAATAPTNVLPGGAFGGSAGVIPVASAAVPPPPTATPAVANGADAGISIDLSNLTLSSQLNLGNLGQAQARATPAAARA